MNTRYGSVVISLLIMVIPSPGCPLTYSMENESIHTHARNDQSLQAEELGRQEVGAESLRNAQDAAFTGLKTMLSQLVKADALDEKHAQELGLTPTDFVALTSGIGDRHILSDAIRIFHVDLKELQKFARGQIATSLLVDTHQLLFSVKINKDDKLSVMVRSVPIGKKTPESHTQGTHWRPTRWGLPNLTRQLATEQKRIKEQNPALKDFSLISIPSLNRNFLGYDGDTGLQLVPLVSDQLFEKGKPLSADKAFLILSQEAKSVDGSPR